MRTHPLALDGATLGFRRPEHVDRTIPAARLELTDQGIAEIEGGARWIRSGSWDSGPIGGRIAGR
jgi:hypothetical protein